MPREALEGVAVAREAGTRLTGVQVGNRGRTGLHAVCDPVHVFREWVEVGGERLRGPPVRKLADMPIERFLT